MGKTPIGIVQTIYGGRQGQFERLTGTYAAEDVQRRLASDRSLDHLAEHTRRGR